ncbi:MGDG synthase family glycosyltransferase [Desnuesiella massiliensis]|uniref:MGDG synthase family glycosyltransferase n=1 Tax=Desnuesiella massiliensis TaxID=1650662 RepID=UPI0006E40189|nr:glycosyltransferase [Desnuesiella massiliensis]
MRLLILSVSAGGGHMNAAEAVKAHTLINSPTSVVKIVDTIRYINPILDKVIIGSYLKSLKIYPSIFGALYNYAENDDALANVTNKVNEMLAYKLLPLIDSFNPDLIVSTHPFSTEMLSILKTKGRILKKVISILTDYAPHSFWIHPAIDAYVVSNEDMVSEMELRGVNPNTIYPLGIPVHPDFLIEHDRCQTLKALNLNTEKNTLLLMGGSLGMGNLLEVYREISKIDLPFQIITITGNNKKLFSTLLNEVKNSSKETRIIGYTNEVNKYMQACDLLVTKPGGLTVSEALICKIPLAIFSAIPGQEEKNADFLLRNNLAVSLGNGKECKNIIEDLLGSSNKLKEMKDNCYKFDKSSCGSNIVKLMFSMVYGNLKS